MLCPNPANGLGGQFPCGQCVACRINKQRGWAARIIMESLSHQGSIFVTLTYAEEYVPHVHPYHGWGYDLEPRHLELFLKRLRERIRPRVIRFFAVGEYGADPDVLPPDRWPPWMDEHHWARPHFHLVLFGLTLDELVVWHTRRDGMALLRHPDVHAAWGMGHTDAGELTPDRAAYCAGYVTKKLTKRAESKSPALKVLPNLPDCDPVSRRLHGRRPEFARMSKKPGLGALEVPTIAEALLQADPEATDVSPIWTDHRSGRTWPTTRFVETKLREELGMERLARDRPPRATSQEIDDDVIVPGLFRQEIDAYAGTVRSLPLTRREVRAREAAAKAERNLARQGRKRTL